MPSQQLRAAARSALSRICLANALEPSVIALHDRTELVPIIDDVARRFDGYGAAEQDDAGLMRAIDETCRGDFLPLYQRGPSPYLGKASKPLATLTEGLSTVVRGDAVGRLIDAVDLDALLAPLLITGRSSCVVPLGGDAEDALKDRSPPARAKRRVRLSGGQLLGNPVLWATRTALIDAVIDDADVHALNRAEAATDALGLIMPPFSPSTLASNQRWVFHLPATLVQRLVGFRPTAVEAGGYPRFKARPMSVVPPAGWGVTMDLGKLASGAGLCDGQPELTLWPITTADFAAGERIELEFLGAITQSRGETKGFDCDDTVADILSDGRSAAKMLRAVR